MSNEIIEFEDTITLYTNNSLRIDVNQIKKILYVIIIDGNYNKDNFLNAIEYYKNFWILVSSTNEKYYQMFVFNNANIYPLEFYDNVFKTLKSLESIFSTNLHSSCLVNSQNAMDILRPLLNMYKAVRPFNFVKTTDEGFNFLISNSL